MNAATFHRDQIDWILSHVSVVDMSFVQSVVTFCALSWLLHRAWLTLWKPVPELISILGVEVPDSPEVSLAGIRADAITLHWSRPAINKPVVKYLIQVNGVNVGESSRLETAITVTGLKPAHFYNVRVISVGSNNFQAGSQVIRLRTYNRDGRPQVENGRMPANFQVEELQNGASQDSSDESPAIRGHGAGIETAALPEGSHSTTRDSIPSGQRRNTVGRKHSPSTAAADQAAASNIVAKKPEESMQQLTERFESIRRETEEVMSQVAKDTEEFKLQISDLTKERDEKKQTLKEKEESSEKLKKEVNLTERVNRQAQNRKSQKEKVLREKQAERKKMQDDLKRWEKDIENMKAERISWKQEKERLEQEKEEKTKELQATIRGRQNSLNGLEEEIRVKGLQIKELEEERQHLPGAQDDDESRALDAEQREMEMQWEVKEKELLFNLNSQAAHLRQLEGEFLRQQAIYSTLSARQQSNPIMYHGNSSGVDFDPTNGQGKAKSRRSRNRKSRTNTISSPIASFPITGSPFPSADVYNNYTNDNTVSPTFAPGPFFHMTQETAMVPMSEMNGMSEADVRALTAGAPLSPTATSLLPSNIFADDEPPSPGSSHSFGPALSGKGYENDPKSPSSSSGSASLMSSPRNSDHNLAMYGVQGPEFGGENDRKSLSSQRADFGSFGAPESSEQPILHKGLSNLFSFPRVRGKTMDGPALGTLKQGQSQSFPRSTEEPESSQRQRRISFSSGWPTLFTRALSTGDTTAGNAPAPARNLGARRRRGFNMFNSSIDDPSGLSERDASSPRPLSIASSDLPRPSTDSAPFGWPVAESLLANRNSPLAPNWSIHQAQTWSSRNPSRRPSIQHTSSNGLTTGIASDDDEFLPPETLIAQTSPPPAGVIGSRPMSSHKALTPKLNPAAPAFKGMFNFSSKADKEKAKSKGKDKAFEASDEPMRPSTSPSDSRKSRDTHSIHTQHSVSESHESLEMTYSNTPSEITNPSTTSGKDKSFRHLLRKGSSSKFSLSNIRKDSIFGGKKTGSNPSSDRNSTERDGSFDEFGEDHLLGRSVESVTSSPMIVNLGSSDWKNKESGPGTPKEGRMSVNWGRFPFSKKKERARDEDRSEAETTGTEDEGVI